LYENVAGNMANQTYGKAHTLSPPPIALIGQISCHILIKLTHSFLQITSPYSWTRFSHPEDGGSKCPLRSGTILIYILCRFPQSFQFPFSTFTQTVTASSHVLSKSLTVLLFNTVSSELLTHLSPPAFIKILVRERMRKLYM